jgi:hypothetical protein
MTDNMSKISRIFEFDSDIFSSGVYERAFRGSVRDLLKRRQQTLRTHLPTPSTTESTMPPKSLNSICLLGPDQIGLDFLINTIPIDGNIVLDEWTLHQWEIRKLFLSLVATIVESLMDLESSNSDDIGILRRFMKSERYTELELELATARALKACIRIWKGAVQLDQEFHAYNSSGKRTEFMNMVFWVETMSGRVLSITSGNYAASLYAELRARSEDLS